MSKFSMVKPNHVIDIAPLWEDQYTGIANVVLEIAKRALNARDNTFRFQFSLFEHVIDRSFIEDCVTNLNGSKLRSAYNAGTVEHIEHCKGISLKEDIALFLHVKPGVKRFRKEASLYYDLSFLSVAETHHAETIAFHVNGLAEQVRTTDQFFTISEATALDLQWYFDIPKERIQITYLGHNTDLTLADEFVSRTFDRVSEPYFVCLGTIEPRKNIDLIMKWLSHNREILSSCRFIFCGREGWGPSFSELIGRYGLDIPFQAGRIVHLGYVTQKQKAALLSGAQALVFASLFEGFGLPVLEAMAQSVPVLASCSTSVPEVMGEDGIYFDPCSIDSFTRAFAQFTQERRDGRLASRVERLRQRATQFSYDNMFNEITEKMLKL